MPTSMRRLRFELQKTLDDIYLATGIPPSSLSRYERGIIRPTPEKTALIARALGQPIEVLYPEERKDDESE